MRAAYRTRLFKSDCGVGGVSELVEDDAIFDGLLVFGPADAGGAGGNEVYCWAEGSGEGVLEFEEFYYSGPGAVFAVEYYELVVKGGEDQLGDVVLLADGNKSFGFGWGFRRLKGGH